MNIKGISGIKTQALTQLGYTVTSDNNYLYVFSKDNIIVKGVIEIFEDANYRFLAVSLIQGKLTALFSKGNKNE